LRRRSNQYYAQRWNGKLLLVSAGSDRGRRRRRRRRRRGLETMICIS
jgi:hypothetical protein